jgi:hypothetical protein
MILLFILKEITEIYIKEQNRSLQKQKKINTRKTRRKAGGAIPVFTGELKTDTKELLKDVEFLNSDVKSKPDVLQDPEISVAVNAYQEISLYINSFLRTGFELILSGAIEDILKPHGKTEIHELTMPLKEEEEYEPDELDAYYDVIDMDLSNVTDPTDIKKIELALNMILRNFSKNIMKIIDNIDKAFTSTNSTVFAKKTVLYRATDLNHQNKNMKSFISTSKSLETLLEMGTIDGKETFFNKNTKCCLNVYIVDAGIPYLDLEFNQEYWEYQKEVLLPRGLKITPIDEAIYDFQNQNASGSDRGHYKVYFFHVTTKSKKGYYKIPAYDKFDINQFYDYDFLKFFYDDGGLIKSMNNLYSFFSNIDYEIDDGISDVIENNIKYKISTFSESGFRYKFPKDKYNEESKQILKCLKDAIDVEMNKELEENINPKKCKTKTKNKRNKKKKKLHDTAAVLRMINTLLSKKKIAITESNFSIKKCS